MAGRIIVPTSIRAIDGQGRPVPSAKLYFYEVGTTEPKPVYTDLALTEEALQPIVSDGQGYFGAIYAGTGQEFRVLITTAAGSPLPDYPVDLATVVPLNITNAADIPFTALPNLAATTVAQALAVVNEKAEAFQADFGEGPITLGIAATRGVQSGTLDTTAGVLLEVGSFGLGASSGPLRASGFNVAGMRTGVFYKWDSTTTGRPLDSTAGGGALFLARAANIGTWLASLAGGVLGANEPRLFAKSTSGSEVDFGAWREILHEGNSLKLGATAEAARTALGLGPIATATVGVNPTQFQTNSGNDARYLRQNQNLGDLPNPENARLNLGLGTMAEQAAGTGTGQYRNNSQNDARFLFVSANLSDLASVPTARGNLGLGTMATRDTGTGDSQHRTNLQNDGRYHRTGIDTLPSGDLPLSTGARDWVLDRIAAMSNGVIGSYAFLCRVGTGSISPGTTYAASGLRYSGVIDQGSDCDVTEGSAPSGTWRALGYSEGGGNRSGTLFVRIS